MSCDEAQLAERIVVTVGVERGPNSHSVPSIDRQGIYVTCFEEGTWFAWKLERETADPDAKPRKIPRAPWEYEHPERFVGHNETEVWPDLDTACEWVEKLPTYGLANRVPDADERRIAFFDFDDARDPETGEIHPKAWDISQTHDLPAWLSSSRTGLHAFAVVKETPADYRQNTELPEWEHTDAPELELYTNAHFCALTGEHVEGTPLDAPDLIETVGGMLREHGEEKQPDGDAFDPDAEPDLTRDENAAKSRKAVVSAAVLKGRKDRCPVAHGDHDPVDDDADDEREPVDRQHDLGLADEIARRDLLDIDREAAVEHVEQAGTTDAGGNTPDADEPGDSVAERARDAFVVTVDYFHEQLDRELPESVDFDTPREYFTEGRGWDHETVVEQYLGYAPADPTLTRPSQTVTPCPELLRHPMLQFES